MKIFSFFKKQKETIDIKIEDGPKQSNQVAKDEEIYYERVHFDENPYTLDNLHSTQEKQDKIFSDMIAFEKKANTTYHKYSFLKLFSRAADKDNFYNESLLSIDKQINRLKKMQEEVKKRTDIIKYIEDIADKELNIVYKSINEMFDFHRELDSGLQHFQSKYYRHLKMSSFSICNDKSYQELDSLYKSINNLILEYKSINEAYDYIFYNSGNQVYETVKALIECLENSKNKELIKMYDYNYFLNSDFVVALSFPEWIELFTKIKYVMRTANKVELFDFLKFKELYSELEKRYILMLIFNEMISKDFK